MERLQLACERGDLDYVQSCVTSRDPDVDWSRLLDVAHRYSHVSIVAAIQTSGLVPMDDLMKSACCFGDDAFVSSHLDCDVDWKNLLSHAALRGHSSTASLILEKVGPADLVHVACITDIPSPPCKLNYKEMTRTLVDLLEGGKVNSQRLRTVSSLLQIPFFDFILYILENKKQNAFNCLVDYQMYSREIIAAAVLVYSRETLRRECYKFIKESSLPLQDKITIAIYVNDKDFVCSCVRTESDVRWGEMMEIAYRIRNTPLARSIYDNRHPSLTFPILRSVCEAGDIDMIKQNIDVEIPNLDWEGVVWFACNQENLDAIQVIAQHKQFNWCNKQLLLACLSGDTKHVKHNIHRINHKDNSLAWTIYIHAACLSQHMDIADMLVSESAQLGVDVEGFIRRIAYGNYANLYYTTMPSVTVKYLASKMKIAIPEKEITILHSSIYGGEYQVILNSIMLNSIYHKWSIFNEPCMKGWTPLHMLCLGKFDGIDNIFEKHPLLDKYLTFNQEQDKNKLFKYRETQHDNGCVKLKTLQMLINCKVDVDPVDINLQTPLHLACVSGACELALALLNYGANLDQMDAFLMTPIAHASVHGHQHIIKLLIHRKCKFELLNRYEENPLHLACNYNNVEAVLELAQLHDLLNQQDCEGLTPMLIATRAENVQLLEVLCKMKADANIADKEGQIPLHKSAIRGSYECAQILIPFTSVIDTQDITNCTPLHLATSYQYQKLVELFLQNGSDSNSADHLGNTPLHVAGRKEIIHELITHNGKINLQNNYGETPLHTAAKKLELATVKILIENKADVHITDNMGRRLLHTVVTSIYHDVTLRKLCQKCPPAQIKVYPRKGFQVIKFHTASKEVFAYASSYEITVTAKSLKELPISGVCNISIIDYLLSLGEDVDARDYNESSALHLAAESGFLTAVQILLQNKANPSARDKFGHMPVMLALQHPQVFKLLWKVSCKHFTPSDRNKLIRLAHWTDTTAILQPYKLNVRLDLSAKPQNVQLLSYDIDPMKLYDWLQSSNNELPDFMSGWLASLQSLTFVEHQYVLEVMDMLMNDLQTAVAEIDPLVAFYIRRCGSEDEKTKVMLKDEEDCSCVQKNIRFDMFETPTCAGHPVWKAFVELVAKPEYYEHLERVLDDKKRLSQSKLCHQFGKAVAQALANPKLWRKYPNLMRVTVKDVTAGSRKISALLVMWSDEVYPLMEISVDLVPVIDLTGWYPSWCNQHPLVEHIECIALPKWKMTHNIELDLVEVGVFQWRPWFEMMPDEMRQGFRLAKVVRDKAVCPKIEEWVEVHAGDFISTYYLKQCIMKEYTSFYDQEVRGLKPDIHSDLHYARRIYEHLEEAFKKRKLASIFIPEYNLIHDDKFGQYQETAVSYARLCRRLLTPESVAHFKKAYMGVYM